MTLLEVVLLLIVAGGCGAIGQAVSGVSRRGMLASIALGFIGALFGRWLAASLDLPELVPVTVGTTNFPVIWAIIGSALFVAFVSLVARGGGESPS